jgi:hypothetical protein
LALLGCDQPPTPRKQAPAATTSASDPVAAALDQLRAFEISERARTDFAALPPADAVLGPNPYRTACLGGGRAVGVMRGASSLVLLDVSGEGLRELSRANAPTSTTGLAVATDQQRIFAAGEHAGLVTSYRPDGDSLLTLSSFTLPLANVRDLSFARGKLFAVSDVDGAMAIVDPARPSEAQLVRELDGPIRVIADEALVVIDELLGHRLTIRAHDGESVAIVHDGPIWSFALRKRGAVWWLVALGVEDHRLDRSGGFFGNIDSFAFLYRIREKPLVAERVGELNLSELGVVTPKAAAWVTDDRLLVTGYGGERGAVLEVGPSPSGLAALALRESFPTAPGDNDVTVCGSAIVAANPLLDAWMRLRSSAPPLAASPSPPTGALRLGEALLFTTLMAPFNSSDGPHSRFTCETCHYEGGIDGRTHHTGRSDVHATTKPLFGLFNNAPHFTRALDPDLTKVAHAEFRVAGAGSGVDPWFSLSTSDHAWLEPMTGGGTFEPPALRHALMTFAMRFTHRTNPHVIGKRSFDDREREGAAAFRDRCASCHAPRLVTSDARTAVPFADWERLVLSDAGPIVWASDGYRKTGIEPYVHPDGARTTSLRRIAFKRPYFTNGSSRSLEDVLSRARVTSERFLHDARREEGEPLPKEARNALAAFLRLL